MLNIHPSRLFCARTKKCELFFINKPAAVLAFDDVAALERALLGDREVHAADAPPVRQGHDDGEDAVFALGFIAGEDIGGDILADRIEADRKSTRLNSSH